MDASALTLELWKEMRGKSWFLEKANSELFYDELMNLAILCTIM